MDKGGIISYIKNSLIFEQIEEKSLDGTETSTFKAKLARNKWVNITNLYCPPEINQAWAGKDLRLATDIIPVEKNSLIAGDFNAHSFVWERSNLERKEQRAG